MKKNTFYIDNRAEWKIKQIMHEYRVSNNQLDGLSRYNILNEMEAKHPKLTPSVWSMLHSFRYIFN